MTASLAWRVEEACNRAWPALEEVPIDGWLARFAGGISRRANSANPRGAEMRNLDAGVDACETLYRSRQRPVLFRIPSLIDPGVDRLLGSRGYRVEGERLILFGGLSELAAAPDPAVEIQPSPGSAWLTTLSRLRQLTNSDAQTYGRIVGLLSLPAAFAVLPCEGEPAALAYGAIHDGLLCYESVITDRRHRGRGLGRRLLATLNAWALRHGAEAACLQVEAANAPARALYRGLGLTAELYRYHYCRGQA